jgi:hypothetical protein
MAGLDVVRKNSSHARIRSIDLQPVATRYIDCVIPSHAICDTSALSRCFVMAQSPPQGFPAYLRFVMSASVASVFMLRAQFIVTPVLGDMLAMTSSV